MELLRSRVARAVLVPLCGWMLAAPANAQTTIQQPDETLPGFKSQQVYDVNGADSVNPFSGDVHVTVPLGPEYPLSSGLTWRLAAHYSSKLWHMFQYDAGVSDPACPSQNLFLGRAHVAGYSTIGAGWTLELGSVRPGAPGVLTSYKSPDGAHHFDSSNLDADSDLRLDPQADGTYIVRKSDGTVLRFTHRYEIPPPVNDFDFSDEDRAGLPRQTLRYGLGSIVDRFGNTVLKVTYMADCPPSTPCPADAWKVHFVDLPDSTRRITFNWAPPSGSYDVVNSIAFPVFGGATSASFAFSTRTISRSTFDSGHPPPSPPAPKHGLDLLLGPSPVNLPFLVSITQTSQNFSFDYDAANGGALQTLTLPTGGKVVYAYGAILAPLPCQACVPEVLAGPACVLGVAPTGPSAPAALDICSRVAFRQPFLDASPFVTSRTEKDIPGGAPDFTTTYERDQFASPEFPGTPVVPNRTVRRVIVKRPGGNANTIATKHVFAAAPGSGGFELSRRSYGDCSTGGAPVRSIVQCFQANAGAPAAPDKICGVMENATKIWDFTNVDSLRPNRQETWYGANPIPDKFTAPNGTTTDGCTNSTASAPCWQDDFTGFNPRASEYTTVIRSSNSDILSASRGATRANTTAWVCPATGTPPPQCNPLGTGIWLPKLYSSKTVTDTPCTFAPCAVTTDFDFDTATGFLNFTSVNDGPTVWMKRSFTRDLTPGAPGDPLTESFTASFDGTTFTNTRAFQSGLATSSRRTAPPGIAWKEFDVDRNTSTGLIATSRDPNGLATTYQYDALSRLTSINPPGGDLATTYCYNDWVPSSPSGRPYVLVKKGGSVCLPDDGAPGLGSGSFEAYQYDGRGRLVRQAKRLPNALAGTGSSVFSFKEIRYNSAGLKSFESEWVPCAVTAGPNNVTSCFSTPALPGNATSYSNFDFLGRPKTVLAPDGFITTRSFDDVSAVPNSDFFEFDTFSVGGRTVKGGFRKDILGRTLLVAEPGESPPAPYGWVSSYNYNVLDKLAAVNVPIGSGDVRDLPQPPAPPITPQTRTFTYDALGLLRSEFHPEKGTTTYTDAAAYDALGNVKKKTEAGHTYAYAYDAVGRLRTVSADTSPYVSNFYDGQAFAGGTFPLGRLTQQNGYHPLSSPNVQVQQNYTYSSPAGRLSSKSSNAINGISFFNASESFTYNALGLLDTHDHARTSGSSSVTTGYRSGLPTQITSNGASYVSSVTYNPAGGLQSYMTGNGVMTTITQDPALLPRPRSISTSGADQNFSAGPYFYDSVGNVMSIGSDAFEYDVRSRLTKATYASFGPQVDTLKYDAFGNLTRRDFEGSQFQDLATSAATNRLNSATYDTLGNLTLNGSDQHFYDTLSRQTQYTGSGASERYFCDGAGERLARVVSAISLPQQSSQERFFNLTPCRILDTRDPAGTYGGPSIAGQGSRSFPVAGRCGIPANAKSLALNVTTVSATTTGNVRLFPTGLSYQPPGTANAYKVGYTRGNQTFGSIDGPTAASFTLFNDAPAGNSVHVIVDVQGYFAPGPNTPPQTGESWFFTLRDPGNRPSVEYRWDSATSTATLLKDHVYLGNLLVADYTSSGQPNGLVFYTNDHLGTPRFMTEGAVPKWMATYKYRAFGLALTPQIPGQGLEFASMERDLASSDLYDHARYMGGKLPKFNSPDKLGGHVEDPLSWNRYSYARNNPIRYYDPNGKEVADGVQLRKDRDYALATGGPSGLASFDRASMQGLKYGLMAFGAMAAYGAVAEYGPALLAAGQQFLSRFGDRVERAISEANPVLEKVGSDLATKGEAREVLSKMGLPNAQADAVRSAISRATSSDTIDILRSKAGDVVVNLTRPGADGRQVMEYTIGQDGAKIPIQKAYDVFGNLVHLDPK